MVISKQVTRILKTVNKSFHPRNFHFHHVPHAQVVHVKAIMYHIQVNYHVSHACVIDQVSVTHVMSKLYGLHAIHKYKCQSIISHPSHVMMSLFCKKLEFIKNSKRDYNNNGCPFTVDDESSFLFVYNQDFVVAVDLALH